MKSHILFIIPSLKTGGSERVFSYLLNEIDTHKFKVQLIILDGSNIQYPINNFAIEVYDLNCKSVLKSIPDILKIVRKSKPNLLVSTLTHLNIILAILKPFLGKGIKLIGRESSILSKNNKNQPFPSLFNFLTRKFYKNFDLIVCQSKDMYNDFLSFYSLDKSKLQIINNPVGFPKLSVHAEKHNPITFITVGRAEQIKGYDRILHALKKIEIDFKYLIIGDGAFLEQLKRLAEEYGILEKVCFMGNVKNPISLYSTADIYLHGSYYEGFPNTLIEAAGSGLPIVAYNSPGGINEIVIDKFNGLLVEDFDDDAFTKAILLSTTFHFDKNKIQDDIYQRFDMQVIIKRYEESFIKTLNSII
jgi:glycosyltransferase involved in cell wall biosynthesis